MNLGFSYVGFVFILLLMIPNLIWTKYQPIDYEKYVINENKILLIFERVGEIFVTTIALIFTDFNIHSFSNRSIWLIIAIMMMIMYEIYWIRYFKSAKTMADFYCNLWHIPLAGATLPVIAFFLLGIYGKNLFMIISVIILGIGHIGIHFNHQKESKKMNILN